MYYNGTFQECNLEKTNIRTEHKRLIMAFKAMRLLYVSKYVKLSSICKLPPEPIFHKDMKPENILVNQYLEVKLCNLGLSKFEINMPTNLQTTIGNEC